MDAVQVSDDSAGDAVPVGSTTWLRARFAARMAAMYAREVPAYTTLVAVAQQVNAEVAARDGAAAERLGSLERVSAERHGAIRVGTPAELAQAGRLFAAFGMHSVGFYDLRDAVPGAVPVVSTAFRPTDPQELARNPFRMFTSVLVSDDRRFFSADLQARLETFLSRRVLFEPELMALADRAAAEGGLSDRESAEQLVQRATAAFAQSTRPVDAGWYAELETVSAVAADIGGVASTHINHLTPRVLDIDELYTRMGARGVEMIDAIQGPPRWTGPDLLLRQTSFRALAEPRTFRDADGTLREGALRVRFGEVEARGVALTPAGRERYDQLIGQPAPAWDAALPTDETGLLSEGLMYATVSATGHRAHRAGTVAELIGDGVLRAEPIVYEDFLPRSAAGIFQSNLSGEGSRDRAAEGVRRDAGWLGDVLGAGLAEPAVLYAAQQQASIDALPGAVRASIVHRSRQ